MLMTKTLDDYRNTIKKRYEEVKNDDLSGLLSHPTSVNLRTLCSMKAEEKINRDDLFIFKRFFGCNEGDDIFKKIENFDPDKLKPVGNFLRGKTTSTSRIILELIAVLVNFEFRPFMKFSKANSESVEEGDLKNTQEDRKTKPETSLKTKKEKKEKKPDKIPVVVLVTDDMKAQNGFNGTGVPEIKNANRSFPKLLSYGSLGLLLLFFGYSMKTIYYPPKDCLQWTTDHYEAVPCKGAKIQSMYEARIIEWNAELLTFRKLTVTKKTRFFINGKPAVWYSKENNVVEFFNVPGVHPITGESLKPVTRHIVETYGLIP